jgi:Rrf2 family iron-sulfur cluster assembly transcriptional regulator
MTVIFSKKCEYGIQAVLYLAAREKGTLVSAEEISKVLKIPREFVSKILQSLRESGLILSSKGKSGGFTLAKDPSRVKLLDVVAAIDDLDMFDNCVLGFPECTPTHPCPVHDTWGTLRTQAYDMLNSETIDKLKEQTLHKISSL